MIDCHSHFIIDKFLPMEIYIARYDEIPEPLIALLVANYKKGHSLIHVFDKIMKATNNRLNIERFMDAFVLNYQDTISRYKVIQQQNNISLSIILSLDLEFVSGSALYPAIPYLEQVELFSTLAKTTNNTMLPFFMVDPRRENVFNLMVDALENKGFLGVKMYPPLGYCPDFSDKTINGDKVNKTLQDVYSYCEYNKIPITAHCSPNGVKGVLSVDTTHKITHPMNYFNVLYAFPNLHLNLAHFGSNSHFKRFFNMGVSTTWTATIYKLLQEFEYLFTDIAFHNGVVDDTDTYFKAMYKALDDPFVATKLLFGMDTILHYTEYSVNEFFKLFNERVPQAIQDDVFTNNANLFLFDSSTTQIPQRILKCA